MSFCCEGNLVILHGKEDMVICSTHPWERQYHCRQSVEFLVTIDSGCSQPTYFKKSLPHWRNRPQTSFLLEWTSKLICYASRKPDPEATYVDAFSIKWNDHLLYAFPLFSLIAQCFQKIEMEKSELIVPMLDTQPRYSQLLRMLTDVPRTLPQRPDTLQMPGRKGMTHALIKKMTLMVCRVSGDPLKHKEFQNELQTSYYNLGNREHENNMHRTSNGGLSIAIGNMSVVLIILFP